MHNVLTLLKMEFINRFGKVGIKDTKAIIKAVFSLILSAALFAFAFWAAKVFFGMFDKAGLAYEVLVLFFTVIFVFLLFTNISSTIKVLYFKGDNEILMRFPVAGWEVFWAKTIYLLVSQLVITSLLLIPFLIAYGNVVSAGGMFYGAIPFVVLFMVLVPFFLSNILAIPFMQLSNSIRHKFGMIIVALAVLMTAIFFVYTLLFEKAVIYLRDEQTFSVFDDDTVMLISNMIRYFVPTKYFAGMMLGEFEVTRIINRETIATLVGDNRALSFSAFIVLLELSIIGSFLVIKFLYQKTLLANIEIEGSAYTKLTQNKVRPIFRTLLHKEFVQVFRSVNYSFQYFVLACSMPVMVFFCNRIAISIGLNDIGNKIVPGLTLLIMLIFNTVIISFSASSITREGGNFYHTKVMPVPIRTQLAVKFVMYFLVSFIANTVTTAIIILTKQMEVDGGGMDFMKPLAIYGISLLVSIGLTLYSMKIDIIRPRFNLSGDGELVSNNANTTNSVLMGLIIAVLFGVVGMLMPYVFGNLGLKLMFYVLLGGAAIFFIFSLLFYCIKLTATYNKIV